MARPKIKAKGFEESWTFPRLLSLASLTLCLWVAFAPKSQAIKLAELNGLSYSSAEFLVSLKSLPAETYRRVMASEDEARNILKGSLLDKHFAEQARKQGLDTLPLVQRALALRREEVLIDWHVQSEVGQDLVRRARRKLEETSRESVVKSTEFQLQQAFVSRDEPNARALIKSISRDLKDNAPRRSFAEVLSPYLEVSDKSDPIAGGRITNADFDMGWHELADIELRFRPFLEGSSAGDIFGPLRLESGWIFLTVVDKRQTYEISTDQTRNFREAIVAELTDPLAQGVGIDSAPKSTLIRVPPSSRAATELATASLAPLVQEMGGLFQDLASPLLDGERPITWQQRRERHRRLAGQIWDMLGDERPDALLARLSVIEDRLLSRLQARALAAARVGKTQVTDAALNRIYQQNIERFYVPAQIQLRQIFLSSDAYSDTEVKTIHGQVLLDPRNFDAIALDVNPRESNIGSDGQGKLIELRDLDPALFKVMLTLEVGEISEPITSRRGSHIVLLDRFIPASVQSRDDVRGKLIDLHKGELVLTKERQLKASLMRKVVVY